MPKGINGNKNSIGILLDKIIYQTFKVHLQQILAAYGIQWLNIFHSIFPLKKIITNKKSRVDGYTANVFCAVFMYSQKLHILIYVIKTDTVYALCSTLMYSPNSL